MTHAYLRRRRWEAEATAAAVVEKLSEALNAGEAPGRNNDVNTSQTAARAGQANYITLRDGRRAQVVSPDAFLSIAGSP